MERTWDIVKVLRFARHDWLNKIQLIKGNLSLNKLERAQAIIDEIVMEAQQEARLTNLNLPQFAALILTANWKPYHFQLEYEVLGEITKVKVDDSTLSEWTRTFFSNLNNCVEPFQENHLSISILPEENRTILYFDFTGSIQKQAELKEFLLQEEPLLLLKEFSGDEISFEMEWTYTYEG
ncbi:Spo0B C-terminal domain-containing protein [Pseudoneobacillus sp. C159]